MLRQLSSAAAGPSAAMPAPSPRGRHTPHRHCGGAQRGPPAAPVNAAYARDGRAEQRGLESTRLRLFLDSANIPQWELWTSTGLFYGITTNPSILERDSQRCTLKNLQNLCRMADELGVDEIQFQAWGDSPHKMVSVALDLFGMNSNIVVVKLPCTLEGLQAAALLRESSVRVTVTGIYSSQQVLLAQALGAEYAAPYLGRMNDAYGNNKGYQQVVEMQQILAAQRAQTRLLVASVRETSDLSSLAAQGCDTFTISPAVAGKLFNVSYTLDAAADFEAAARRMGAYEQDPPGPGPAGAPPEAQAAAAGASSTRATAA